MGKPISLFSDFSKSENRTTNYCLLVLKMVYEENPRYLAGALTNLLGDEVIGNQIGVVFSQQEKQGNGIPDGLIVQKPITIFIETKNSNQFDEEQLKRHLQGLDNKNGSKILVALGLFEEEEARRLPNIQTLCQNKQGEIIFFAAKSFEEFIECLQLPHLTKNLADNIEELRAYFDKQKLLPSWKGRLDVVNCKASFDEIEYKENEINTQGGAYICPASGGAYSHKRSEFFGTYRDKKVEKIAQIRAVIDVKSKESAEIMWKNNKENKSELIREAIDIVGKRRPNDNLPYRVFLLGQLYDTNFIKDSRFAMQGSKQYFNVAGQGKTKTAKEVADELKDKVWSQILGIRV